MYYPHNLLVKLHPRSLETKYNSFNIENITGKDNAPSEILFPSRSTSKKIIIINLSAVLTAQRLYEKNNPVIFLYKFIDLKE